MKKSLTSTLGPVAAVALAFALSGCMGMGGHHKSHHPDAASAGQGKPGGMQGSMPMMGNDGKMMEMCKGMMPGKTPQEQKAAMDEHMKSMSPEMRDQCMMMHKQMGSPAPAR